MAGMRWSLVAAVITTVLGSRAVAAPVKVAIIPSITVNLDTARVDALTADLAESLAAQLDVEALGGLDVRRQLPVEGEPPECVTTPSCTADVARRLGATQLLFLVMVRSGDGLQVDATWVEPATGRSVSRPAIDVANLNEAKVRFEAVASQLLPEAPIRTRPTVVGPQASLAGVMSAEIPRHFTTPTYVTAAVGVAGLGVGVALGLVTRGHYNTCETSRTCDPSTRDSIRLTGLLADAGYLVGIGGAVATGILFATSGEHAHLVVAPTTEHATIVGVTIGATGTF